VLIKNITLMIEGGISDYGRKNFSYASLSNSIYTTILTFYFWLNSQMALLLANVEILVYAKAHMWRHTCNYKLKHLIYLHKTIKFLKIM